MDACWIVATQLACLPIFCHSILHVCWLLPAIPAGMVSHYQPCLLVWCLTIGHICWCGTHYKSCLLWYGASPSAMPVGVVPHYRPYLLACYLTIDHAYWSVATATNILLVECRWKKGGYKSCATCTEVSLPEAVRAVEKKCLLMASPPEPLVRIQNDFTELFLMVYSAKIAQMVLLH